MSDTIEHYFKTITHTFLDKEWVQGFSIYYRSMDGNKANYLVFAQYTPDDYTRLEKIMKEADRQEFFIHENDLIRYYRECILVRLRDGLEKDKPKPLDIVHRTYPVIRRIISDYLDFNLSSRVLRSMEAIPEILCPLFKEETIHFPPLVGLSLRDNKIETHCTNVGLYCLYFANAIKLPNSDMRDIFLGGLFGDIGKKEFPERFFTIKKELSEEDWNTIRKHPSNGRKILNDMKCYSDTILKMVGEHHENFDGSGYPFGLREDRISLGGRMARIMDVFDAMTCDRSYHEPYKVIQALTEIKDRMDGQFDPRLLTALFKSFTS